MKPITRKQAVKKLDHFNERLARVAVELENEVEEKMDKFQKVLIDMDKFRRELEGRSNGKG